MQGVYVSTPIATAGRLVSFSPERALDTRTAGVKVGADQVAAVSLISAGVPADASAAVLNVTATDTNGAGYLTVWAPNVAQPLASNLNVDAAMQTRATK